MNVQLKLRSSYCSSKAGVVRSCLTAQDPFKPSSQYDASQRVRKNRTNFYSSVWVKTGARRHASLGNGSEPASSELRVATRHIVN